MREQLLKRVIVGNFKLRRHTKDACGKAHRAWKLLATRRCNQVTIIEAQWNDSELPRLSANHEVAHIFVDAAIGVKERGTLLGLLDPCMFDLFVGHAEQALSDRTKWFARRLLLSKNGIDLSSSEHTHSNEHFSNSHDTTP